MAFRIHESVVRGEIDNRVKGTVRGKVWVEGRSEPIILELTGNACPDLAGCRLTFSNPQKRIRHRELNSLQQIQSGQIGDITASRKVRVPSVPMEQFLNWPKGQGRPPSHWANCLYLEWFSEQNGRVVIESTDYELSISEPEWRLTPIEEEERAKLAAGGMSWFMQRLSAAIEEHQHGQKDPDEQWDEHDYEKFLKESDARADKYMELLDKYGDSDDADEKIAEEMGWTSELTPEEAEEESRQVEEMNRACNEALSEPPPEPDPSRKGIDWIRTKDGELRHPLEHRCRQRSLQFLKRIEELPKKHAGDHDLNQFISEWLITGVKLAGALNGLVKGRPYCDDAFTVAYLKRALDHLHKSQASLEALAPRKVLHGRTVAAARRELFTIREGILKLMDRFRGRENS